MCCIINKETRFKLPVCGDGGDNCVSSQVLKANANCAGAATPCHSKKRVISVQFAPRPQNYSRRTRPSADLPTINNTKLFGCRAEQ